MAKYYCDDDDYSGSDENDGFECYTQPTQQGASSSTQKITNSAKISNSSTTTSSSLSKSTPMASYPPASIAKQAPNFNKRPIFPLIPDLDVHRAINISKNINTLWNRSSGRERSSFVEFKKILTRSFPEAKNPYSLTLRLVSYSNDFLDSKAIYISSFAIKILLQLKQWLIDESLTVMYEKSLLKPNLQKVAFEILTLQPNSFLYKPMFEIFRLDQISALLIEPINLLISSCKFKEACQSATCAKLFDQFDIEAFVLPLFLQGREQVAEDYLISSKNSQNKFLKYLDNLLGYDSAENELRNYAIRNKIEDVQFHLLTTSGIKKLTTRLCKKFGVDEKSCPNTSLKQKRSTMHYLINRRYVNIEPMTDDGFDELLDEVVKESKDLQNEAFSELRMNGDTFAAARFAFRFLLPLHTIPSDVLIAMHKINPSAVAMPSVQEEQSWDEDWDIDETQTKEKPAPVKEKEKLPIVPILKGSPIKSFPNVSGDSSQLQNFNKIDTPDEPIFYKALLPRVEYMKTIESFYSFLSYLDNSLRNGGVNLVEVENIAFLPVGFDLEWNPLKNGPMALMQLATFDSVFLLDFFQIVEGNGETEAVSELLLRFLEQFFKNNRVLKIGFGLSNDYGKLSKSSPNWENIKSDIKSSLDLNDLATEILKVHPGFFPHRVKLTHGPTKIGNFSDLVESLTQLPLCKDEQFSNWERRPLRPSQILYAATDAFCALDVFDMIRNRASELKLEISPFLIKSIKKTT